MLVVSSVLFGSMAFLVKLATVRLPGPQVAFMRFVVGLIVVGIAGLTFVRLRPVNLKSLFLRGFFGGLAVLLFFVAIEKLPVGTATLLNYTAPVFTAIDAWIFLGEAVSIQTFAALGLTLAGVTLVVQGGAQPGRFGFGIWELCGHVSAYDATHVALAEGLGCSLVTADARLAAAPGLRCDVTVVPR